MTTSGTPTPHPPIIGSMPAFDLFPELEQAIDYKVAAAENRVKYWVIGGTLANVIGLLMVGVPLVYNLGRISEQAIAASEQLKEASNQLRLQREWQQDRMLWESAATRWMEDKGFKPPPDRRSYSGN